MSDSSVSPSQKADQMWKLVVFLTVVASTLARGYNLGFPHEIYFDEVHYVHGAEDYMAGRADSNWSHPPLAKLLMALVMSVLGINPSGWRVTSLLCSTLTVVCTAFTARALGGTWRQAAFASLLLSLDFLSCVQARIAMLDGIQTLFITAGCCACCYALKSEKSYWLRQFIAGLLFGFATASKWNGLFAMVSAALAVLWITRSFKRFLATGFLYAACVASVYVVSYIPFLQQNLGGVSQIRSNHETMYLYRQGKGKYKPRIHPFQSNFLSWPLVKRPVYFYCKTPPGEVRSIVALGNPLFWWMSFLILGSCLTNRESRAKKSTQFLTATILVQWLSWGISGSDGFIYYMLPIVPQMALLVAEELDAWWTEESRALVCFYLSILGVTYCIYFPTLTGLAVPHKYYEVLYCIPTWH